VDNTDFCQWNVLTTTADFLDTGLDAADIADEIERSENAR
jgi:hypothetical protein